MTYVPAAPEFDRLPWLSDDTKQVARSKRQMPLILWSGLAALLVAGGSYWAGMTSSSGSDLAASEAGEGASSATISLPEPYDARSEEQVALPAMPAVEPVAAPPPVKISAAPRRARVAGTQETGTADRPQVGSSRAAEAREAARAASLATAAEAEEEPKASAEPLEPWPSEQSQGAAGRMVRIGTFGSRLQAKRGWRAVVRVYPGMNALKAVVVPHPSLRNGRTYYRLQFGTTSQAHSTVLCQRMRSIGQSCVIVGSPSGEAG